MSLFETEFLSLGDGAYTAIRQSTTLKYLFSYSLGNKIDLWYLKLPENYNTIHK